MKFIHAADFHIGATPESSGALASERQAAVKGSLDRVVDLCNREDADLLLIAGDLFHRRPLRFELKEVAHSFSRLVRTRVVMIAGNHDYVTDGDLYSSFDFGEHVHFLTGKEPFLDKM